LKKEYSLDGIGIRASGSHGEDQEEDIAMGVGEWSKAIVLLCACSIPQPEIDGDAINRKGDCVIVKYCGHI
jgi:hypothetical protein